MKKDLFSEAHIETAATLFPDKDSDWFRLQWTDDELNACKKIEFESFITQPSLATFPKRHLFESYKPVEEVLQVEKLIKEKKSFLSIGCGLGEKEMWLARMHPQIQFVATDNAPYVEGLNEVAKELGINNIVFRKIDLRKIEIGTFDVVYSFAVIYCIPDEYLTSFFNLIYKLTKPGGVCLVGCSSNYNIMLQLINFLNPKRRAGTKKIGYLRSVSYLNRFVPSNLGIFKIFKLDHFSFPRFKKVVGVISRIVWPISDASYLIVMYPKY
jgi:SAM-dependent methyltransferase